MDPKLTSLIFGEQLPAARPPTDLLLGTPPPATPPLWRESVTPQTPVPNSSPGLTTGAKLPPAPTFTSSPGFAPSPSAPLPPFMPTLIALVGQIRHELENNLARLLALNPGRREGIAAYLDRLAGHAPGPSAAAGTADAAGGLRRWVDSARTTTQNAALKTYLEEVALFTIGQAILLKHWSDRGIHPLKADDLGRLNWVLSSALKSNQGPNGEPWQLTRPNLYSWYTPSATIQQDLWLALESCRLPENDASVLPGILKLARQYQPSSPELKGYDPRFAAALWEHLGEFGFDLHDTGPLQRKRVAFTPTLRDGQIVRTGSREIQWIGIEAQPFPLFLTELAQLWWGPGPAPLWAGGSGLEVHGRDQLALALGSPKPSLYARISEMEACDLAFVFEERTIRSGARTHEAAALRAQLESLPYFKALRSQGTTLGDLQACVALSKLRPGGLLWWIREEPLSSQDGAEALKFLLDRGKLLCEWDFSGIEHGLPVAAPLFPRHVYLFSREPGLEARATHRPLRLVVQGQIRSHIEVPLILGDAFQSFRRAPQYRGNWQIHSAKSPSPQKDWAERWPDPAAHDAIRALEELQNASSPLASVATVSLTPQGDPKRDHAWSASAYVQGLWIRAECTDAGRRIVAEALPRPGSEAHGSGYMITVPDASWVTPLCAYLVSSEMHRWFDHYAERKSGKWILSEQIVKFIPVPKALVAALGRSVGAGGSGYGASGAAGFASALPPEWEQLARDIPIQPRAVCDRLARLARDESGRAIRAELFVRAARAIDALLDGQKRLLSLVTEDGRIRWRDLLKILPPLECVPVTMSAEIQVTGSLPNHFPIGRIERVKAPTPGILLTTETGFTLHLASSNSKILDMLADQLEGLTHPTWNELVGYLRLPRRLEFAEAAASDLLRSHGEQSARLAQLRELLNACTLL